MTLLVKDEEVKKLLTFEETIEAVEDAYRQYGLGRVGGNSLRWGCPIIPRDEMRIEGKNLPHLSPQIRGISQGMAYLEETHMAFVRWGVHLGDKRGNVSCLIDVTNGNVLAAIKGNFMFGMRVGAAGAVGAKYLSREDSRVAGVIGTGKQGRLQLEFLTKVRKIEKVYAHPGRKEDSALAKEYAQEMRTKLGIEILVCDDVKDVVGNADILVTVTKSTQPLVNGKWVKKGLHINAIGADCPMKAELDALTLKKADKLVIDYELALDTKEIRIPLEERTLTLEDIHGTIGEVVAGIKAGREDPSEITIFKSTGMHLAYVAISARIYEKAKKLGLGTDIGTTIEDLIYC
jgi:ornithine cyclodeaminase/alanine dehydrogenase-like protein (mu-crystallin family)